MLRRLRQFRFWPSTLAVQLIAVTAAAVTLSHIAVAFWFEYGNEQQSAIAANERVLDRAASVATTLAVMPPALRPEVMNNMSSRIWKFPQVPAPVKPPPMSDDEKLLARHLGDMLPDRIP